MHIIEDALAAVHTGKGVVDIGFPLTQGFYLGTGKSDAGLDGFQNKIFMMSATVRCRRFGSAFFLCQRSLLLPFNQENQ